MNFLEKFTSDHHFVDTICEIIKHAVVLATFLLSIAGIELLCAIIGISEKRISGMFTVKDLFFYVDVILIFAFLVLGGIRMISKYWRHDA